MCKGMGGRQRLDKGAKGEGTVGSKQRGLGKKKMQGKVIRECPTDGRIDEEEGDHER